MYRLNLPTPKSLFDIVFALVVLILLMPLFILIALFIKVNDNGPFFFKQERIGKNGKPFILYKFRSMSVLKEATKGQFDAGNISRVTTVGKLLRKTKMDELPQLINVIKGNMSLVGPRPEVQKWISVYPERWIKVLTVTPGMTDNASIEFRNEEDILVNSENPEKMYMEFVLPKKLEFYEEYVDNHSFFGDIKLIFKTIYYCIFK
jgi:lipopolysaccharide/colanic/teichoic acid biosynthesis glycosyltransferase